MLEAGIRIPQKYQDPSDIDRTVMVKFPGAREVEDTLWPRQQKNIMKNRLHATKKLDWRRRCESGPY